jgi:hypothetical protein
MFSGPVLPPATKRGFEKLVRGPISLQVGYTTVNDQLKVGSAAQQVTVTRDVLLLKTDPQVTQDWENFIIPLPGAIGTVGGSQGSSNQGQQSRTGSAADGGQGIGKQRDHKRASRIGVGDARCGFPVGIRQDAGADFAP